VSKAKICTASSSATATEECRGNVLVSGSYGGEYNAWHAAKRGLRGVVLNDAGVGKRLAGIRGLDYLDRISLPAATSDVWSCHIGDGEHMLEFGRISHLNHAAQRLGCIRGESVKACASKMLEAPVIETTPPAIAGGRRFIISESASHPWVVGLDAAPMLEARDAGNIVVTGSHAALFRGRPDGVINVDVAAIFFSDAGIGMDSAGITRLAALDERNIASAAASAESAEIGNARSIYEEGLISCANATAMSLGARPGIRVCDFIADLLVRWRKVK
jgi:hypothetical protein